MTILEVENLTVRYGAVRAVDDLSFTVEQGKVVGLIGPNGSGKTTTIDAVTGFVASKGRVTFDGQRLDRLPAHRRVRRGIARTFQSMELFEDLTVRENLLVGHENSGRSKEHRSEQIEWAIDLLGLEEVSAALPGPLPLGRKKLVGVARALASGAKLLLMDEPAAGLDSNESRAFGRDLRRISEHGITVVLVDHDVDLVFEACQEIHVLNFGRLLASGAVEEIQMNSAVRRAYLGDPVANTPDERTSG